MTHAEPQSGTEAQFQTQSPMWAPSSDRLVFVSPKGEGSEIRTVRIDTGEEAVLVTQATVGEEYDFRPSIHYPGGSLGFSPDGKWLAFLASRKPSVVSHEKIMRGIDAHEDWSADGGESAPIYQLFVMELRTREAKVLTQASVNVRNFDWSADSKRLAVEADSEPGKGSSFMTADIYVIDRDGGALRPLVKVEGVDDEPKWSPDGKTIASGSQRGKVDWMYGTTLAVVPADGSAPPRYIGDAIDRLSGGGAGPLRWSLDGKFIDVRALHDLSSHLFRVRVADGATQRVTPRTDLHYGDFSYSRDGRRMAFVAQGAVVTPEVYISDVRKMKPVRLTDCNPQWKSLQLPTVETIRWRSADDKWDISGIVLKLSHFQRGRRYPTLTDIFGGPAMVRQEFGLISLHPLPALAEQGYVVFMPNTRGREGYGADFLHAIRDEQSYVLNPANDVLKGVDVLVEQGIADPGRLGLLGFSYGGTLTAYIITMTDRFRAAVYSEGGPDVLRGNMSTTLEFLPLHRDMGGFGSPYEPSEIKRAYDQSAVYRLDKVRTPVLVESGADGEWETDRTFFRGLRYFGIPAEFVVYPRAGHGIDEPVLLLDSFRRQTAWLDYWLKDQPYPDSKKQSSYEARKQHQAEARAARD